MDLFSAAGIDIGDGGRGDRSGRAAGSWPLRMPLLNPRVVARQLGIFNFDLTREQKAAAASYARTARTTSFAVRKQTSIGPLLFEKILGDVLGYRQSCSSKSYSLACKIPMRHGSLALGKFAQAGGPDEIIAAFGFKGPGTTDVDAITPGRAQSPVQQAWNDALDAPGSRWVLVSNGLEIRLYACGRGRGAFELFDLRKLDDGNELERLFLLLSSDQLLGGGTDALLRQSDRAYKEITGRLYQDHKALRDQLIAFLTAEESGPKLALLQAIETAQKVLDRIWIIDTGGLLAGDRVVAPLVLPRPLAADLARLGQWDNRSDVPVTVMGHVFEQSITDIERLRASARGEAAPRVSKSKRQGVVYTQEIVTRFLVERTVDVSLEHRFAKLLQIHGKPGMPRSTRQMIFAAGDTISQIAFWNDYLAVLRAFTIVDPACGAGAFLVAAFEWLAREYRSVIKLLTVLGAKVDFDPFEEIVTKNLFGVDINTAAVEITRRVLWLKAGLGQHRLQDLAATIKIGDSLISDGKWTDRPFEWRAAFPDVFAQGGFDVVIGNPPYVRMEFIKKFKPYLENHYVVADDRTDLYAYFFELGVRILKDGGRLGFISSSTFFRTGSGEKLRMFLGDTAIESVIDFGDLQIFEGVTTYPAMITLRKASNEGMLSFLKIDGGMPADLGSLFSCRRQDMPRARLGSSSWQFENDALARLRDKIAGNRKTLGEVYGAPLYGIKTGLNEAFIIDTPTRDRLLKNDSKSAELLKPFLKGEDIRRWRVEPEGLFLINTPKGKVDIENYPAIRDWLLPFREDLQNRATRQQWWELQQAQLAYQPLFATQKISYGHFADKRGFTIDKEGFLSNDKSYFIPNATFDLLALLNSRVGWSFIKSISPAVRGGFHELRVQYVEKIPIPEIDPVRRAGLRKLAETCTEAANHRRIVQTVFKHRVLQDLAPPMRRNLTGKLENFWSLDFAGFRAELGKAFKTEIPVADRDGWEKWLAETSAEVIRLTAQIDAAEREIDAIVYGLFELTAEEIKRLEDSIGE